MADIDLALITALRTRTGLGLMECKAALVASEGDLDAAALALRERGEAVAAASSLPVSPDTPQAAVERGFGGDWADETPAAVHDWSDVRVFECAAVGAPLRHDRDAVDLIGAAWGHGASLIAAPAERLDPDFLRLSTRVAGPILQKFSTTLMRLAIIGDLSAELEASKALRDFVYESNRGDRVWFLPTLDALRKRLGG